MLSGQSKSASQVYSLQVFQGTVQYVSNNNNKHARVGLGNQVAMCAGEAAVDGGAYV